MEANVRQNCLLMHKPSGCEFSVFLTEYEINRAETDSKFYEELSEKYYRLHQRNLVTGIVRSSDSGQSYGQPENMDSTVEEQEQYIIDESESQSLILTNSGEGWENKDILNLLSLYLERRDKFRNPMFKNKILWAEIANMLKKKPDECDKKFRNLKQTFVRLRKLKKSSGRQAITWPYFDLMENIFENDTNINPQLEIHSIETLPKSLKLSNKRQFSLTESVPSTSNCSSSMNQNLELHSIELLPSNLNLSQVKAHGTEDFVPKMTNITSSRKAPEASSTNTIRSESDNENQRKNKSHQPPKKRIRRNEDIKKALQNIEERQQSLDLKIERLIHTGEEGNQIQRERNELIRMLINNQQSSNSN